MVRHFNLKEELYSTPSILSPQSSNVFYLSYISNFIPVVFLGILYAVHLVQ